MNKTDNASVSVRKIILIAVILLFVLGVGVIAGNTGINSVKIQFANNHEITVLTSKTKISEILEENHIIVLPEETVVPGLDAEITEKRTIKISNIADLKLETTPIAKQDKTTELNQILENYNPITEKIVTVEEEIPFETITKDIANGSSDTTNKVIQQGKNGLKRVTYRIKYQNDIEIEKTEISSEIIKKPVDKIVQIQTRVTSRYSAPRVNGNVAATLAAKVEGKTPIIRTLNTSAYCACARCCGKETGITASGARATAWYTVAAGRGYPIGTIIYIPALSNKPNGGWFVVQDRGGAISNTKLDIFFDSHSSALSFGRKNLEAYIYM